MKINVCFEQKSIAQIAPVYQTIKLQTSSMLSTLKAAKIAVHSIN